MADQAHMEERARLVKEQAQEALYKLQKCATSVFSNDRWNFAAIALAGVLTSVGLALSVPFLMVLIPVLIPVGVVLFLVAAGVMLAAALLLGVSWLYKYVNGREPPWADQIDAARSRISYTAGQVTERARGCGSNVTGYLKLKAR